MPYRVNSRRDRHTAAPAGGGLSFLYFSPFLQAPLSVISPHRHSSISHHGIWDRISYIILCICRTPLFSLCLFTTGTTFYLMGRLVGGWLMSFYLSFPLAPWRILFTPHLFCAFLPASHFAFLSLLLPQNMVKCQPLPAHTTSLWHARISMLTASGEDIFGLLSSLSSLSCLTLT